MNKRERQSKREKANLVGVRFVVARRFYLCRSLRTSKRLGFGVSQLVRGERKGGGARERASPSLSLAGTVREPLQLLLQNEDGKTIPIAKLHAKMAEFRPSIRSPLNFTKRTSLTAD